MKCKHISIITLESIYNLLINICTYIYTIALESHYSSVYLLTFVNISIYRIFGTIRRSQKQLIFLKTDSAPYSPVRLIYVSNC